MSSPIMLQAEIEGVATRRDRTLKITVGTQELSPEETGLLMLERRETMETLVPEMAEATYEQ